MGERSTHLTLICSEIQVCDVIEDDELLRGDFQQLGDWLLAKYDEQIRDWLSTQHSDTDPYDVEIRFTRAEGHPWIPPTLMVAHISAVNTETMHWHAKIVPPSDQHIPPSPSPASLETIFEVAKYIGAAGIGGIIGNRADALLVGSVRSLLDHARTLWQRQRDDEPPLDDALSAEAAAACAKAAILAMFAWDYSGGSHDVEIADQQLLPSSSEWRVRVTYRFSAFAVVVPPGDPEGARIVIYQEGSTF